MTAEDREKLLDSLHFWGALDEDLKCAKGPESSDRRGYARDPGGGLSARPEFSEPVGTKDILHSGLWAALPIGELYDMQTSLFQPVGGMGKIGEAFARELGPLIRYNAKVIEIRQDEHGVRATFEDMASGSAARTRRPTGVCARFRCRFWARFR